MRKVRVNEYKRDDAGKFGMVDIGDALFHQFGSDYEEFEAGPGNFTTAIVEFPDGRIRSVPVEHVRFLDKEK